MTTKKMKLPYILDIAIENGLDIQPGSYNKKEVQCKCFICEEDSKPSKRNRYYLSLNTRDQVYKCWFCQASGGVLDFESKLTGISYKEVKEKYFGVRKKPLHPAEKLHPNQLEQIGWRNEKRHNRQLFIRSKEEVAKAWAEYEHKQLSKLFAEFMITAHIENQTERTDELLRYIFDSGQKRMIDFAFTKLLEEYVKGEEERCSWAREGTEIARSSWRVVIQTNDFNLDSAVKNVAFLHYFLYDLKKTKSIAS